MKKFLIAFAFVIVFSGSCFAQTSGDPGIPAPPATGTADISAPDLNPPPPNDKDIQRALGMKTRSLSLMGTPSVLSAAPNPGGPNLALSANPSASSVWPWPMPYGPGGSNIWLYPSLAIDGILTSFWMASFSAWNHWYQLSWPSPGVQFNRMFMTKDHGHAAHVMQTVQQIRYYDTEDSTWKTLPGSSGTFSGGTGDYDRTFPLATTTSIIVYLNTGPTNPHPNWTVWIDEIEVYGDSLEIKSIIAVPATLLLDQNGVGAGIVFKAVANRATSVTFKVRSPSGVVQTLGTEATTPDGDDYVAKYGWLGNGASTEDGVYSIIVEADSKSLESIFTVEKLANVAVTGHGKRLDGKGITNTKPAPEEPILCPLVPWDQVDAYKNGVVPNINVLDPVNIAFGNFFHSEVDLTLKSRQSITLARIYNSLDSHVGMFGRGWSSPYASRLEFDNTGVLFVNSDGSRVFFKEETGSYVGPEGSDVALTFEPTTTFWTLKQPAGTEWTFDQAGKLIRMAKSCCGTGATSEVFLTYDGNGKLQRVTNPAGQWVQFTFDTDGLVTRIVDFTGRQLQYVYSADKQLITHTNPIGQATDYTHNEDGFLTQIQKPGNRTTSVVYDGSRVQLLTDPNGNISTFAWDYDNHTMTLTDPQGVVHQYTFSAGWQLTGYTVPSLGITNQITSDGPAMTGYQNSEGNSETYGYSSEGFIETKTDFIGKTTAYEYHPTLHRLTKKTDPLGRIWEYSWCSRGNIISEKNPADGTTLYNHDVYNNRIGKTDPLGRTTQWIYDSTGNRLLRIVAPEGGISSFSYDLRGNLTTSTDPLGRVAQFQYDALDRLVKTIYPDNRFTEIEYDEAGNVSVRRDNLGRETRYSYDLADRLITLTRPDGTTFSYAYNEAGQKISEIDPLDRETKFEYNPIGVLTKTIYPDGTFETMNYDTESRLISKTNELGQATSLEYDPMGRLLATVDPSGARWESQYDNAGRKIADKDPLNRVTTYQLDNLDRITKVVRPDSSFTTNSFDAVGNLLSTVDALGNQWSWVYDNLNRQTVAIQPNGASSTTAFDAAGQVISETDALNRTTQYTFDSGGRRTATKDALGNIWENFYDSAGRLIAVQDPLGAVSSLTYDTMRKS